MEDTARDGKPLFNWLLIFFLVLVIQF
jgi:hypothetical protein